MSFLVAGHAQHLKLTGQEPIPDDIYEAIPVDVVNVVNLDKYLPPLRTTLFGPTFFARVRSQLHGSLSLSRTKPELA